MRVPLAKRLVITLCNIFFPPLAVGMLTGMTSSDTLLNACLFLLAIIPSHIHGFYVSLTYFGRKRKVRRGKWPGREKPFIQCEKVQTGGVGYREAERLKKENELEKRQSARAKWKGKAEYGNEGDVVPTRSSSKSSRRSRESRRASRQTTRQSQYSQHVPVSPIAPTTPTTQYSPATPTRQSQYSQYPPVSPVAPGLPMLQDSPVQLIHGAQQHNPVQLGYGSQQHNAVQLGYGSQPGTRPASYRPEMSQGPSSYRPEMPPRPASHRSDISQRSASYR